MTLQDCDRAQVGSEFLSNFTNILAESRSYYSQRGPYTVGHLDYFGLRRFDNAGEGNPSCEIVIRLLADLDTAAFRKSKAMQHSLSLRLEPYQRQRTWRPSRLDVGYIPKTGLRSSPELRHCNKTYRQRAHSYRQREPGSLSWMVLGSPSWRVGVLALWLLG